MTYKWTPGSRLSGNAEEVGKQLEQIREANHGKLETTQVVRAAQKAKRSALGRLFEWDDAQAAARHREEYARYVIRSIVVTMHDPRFDKPVRAFVQVEKDDDSYYTSISHVMSEVGLREQFLQRALKEMDDWAARYSDFKELAEVFAAIVTVRAKRKQVDALVQPRKVATA